MAWGEHAVVPRGAGTLDRILPVIHEIVAQNSRSGGIGGGDEGLAVNQTVSLKIVHGFGHIVRNDGVVLPKFSNAIDLHSQQDRNALAV